MSFEYEYIQPELVVLFRLADDQSTSILVIDVQGQL